MTRLACAVLFALATFLGARSALAVPTTLAPAAAAAVAGTGVAAGVSSADEATDDSPRASLSQYMQLARRGRWQEAAQYIELPRGQDKRGAELAERLYVVLSRRVAIELNDVSGRSEGRRDDGLGGQYEDVAKLGERHELKTPIRMVRHDATKEGDDAKWMFSAQTVAHVDAWYEALGDTWLRKRLPPFFFAEVVLGFLVYQLVTLPLVALLAYALGALVGRVAGRVVAFVVRREPWHSYVVETSRPLGLAVALTLAHLALSRLGFYLTALGVLARLRDATLVVIVSWLVLRYLIVFGKDLHDRKDVRDRMTRRTLVDLATRAARMVVFALAFLATLNALGFGVTNLVAGLGIGGVALALAAQKTVENLFGSVSILADAPFRVGELIRVDGVEGTVETIGLRSTRLRTHDRTLIVIPNGKLADMRIEAFGPRDRFRVYFAADIDADVDPDKIKRSVEGVRERITKDPKLRQEDMLVRASGLTPGAVTLEVWCYGGEITLAEFSEVRHTLLLDCLRIFRENGLVLLKPR